MTSGRSGPNRLADRSREWKFAIVEPDADGIGEVAVRSRTVMSHYLDDPEMTAETIVDGWLMTGDLAGADAEGHLQVFSGGGEKNSVPAKYIRKVSA